MSKKPRRYKQAKPQTFRLSAVVQVWLSKLADRSGWSENKLVDNVCVAVKAVMDGKPQAIKLLEAALADAAAAAKADAAAKARTAATRKAARLSAAKLRQTVGEPPTAPAAAPPQRLSA